MYAHATSAPSCNMNISSFSWANEELKSKLTALGISELKTYQIEALTYIHQRLDLFIVLPTGYGKSLVYQAAPFLLNEFSTVVVVMPLVALMKQQTERLVDASIRAHYLTDTKQMADIHDTTHLFISPEFYIGEFMSYVKSLSTSDRKRFSCVCVDESHCVVKWGEGDKRSKAFRASYARLGDCRCFLPDATYISLTATATLSLSLMVVDSLQLNHPKIIRMSPDRPNIRYSVIRCTTSDVEQSFDWLVRLVNREKEKTPRMLVFCRILKHVGALYVYLTGQCGTSNIQMYHKSTTVIVQEDICRRFTDAGSDLRVIICSSSFSMGMDLVDVAYIIHYGISADLDGYVQESGRAGRDGQQSHAISIIHPNALKGRLITQSVKDYCCTKECRRKHILSSFGADDSSVSGGLCCDNCDNDSQYSSSIENCIKDCFAHLHSQLVSSESDESGQDVDP